PTESVVGRREHAIVRVHTPEEYHFDLEATQNHFKIGLVKTAIAFLNDDWFVTLWSKRWHHFREGRPLDVLAHLPWTAHPGNHLSSLVFPEWTIGIQVAPRRFMT